VDRFLVKLLTGYPQEREYHDILELTTGTDVTAVQPVASGADVLALRRIVRAVPVSAQVRAYAIHLVMATQPGSPFAPPVVNESVALGSSPRGAQALLLLGKVRALCTGRFAPSCQDLRDVALPVLRHRILLNFEGQAKRITPDEIVRTVLGSVTELSSR
jgi:MoxR-like ATPase